MKVACQGMCLKMQISVKGMLSFLVPYYPMVNKEKLSSLSNIKCSFSPQT